MTIARQFSKTSPIQFQVDYIDSLAGVGYVRFYPAGVGIGENTWTGILTTDSTFPSDEDSGGEYYKIIASKELNFDYDVEKPFTIANKECYFIWSGSRGDNNVGVVWTVYHVSSKGTETSIGTVTGDTIAAASIVRKCSMVKLTKKVFKKGEKLRINAVMTVSSNSFIKIDPAGSTTASSWRGATVKYNAEVLIPIVIPR